MIPVAIIFDNFGPYHIARLQAASADWNLLAIEAAGVSAVYAWEKNSTAGTFRRVTLVEQGTSEGVGRSELVGRLERVLDEFGPGVVVVPGWASPAAWGAMDWCARRGVPMVCMSESTEWDEPRTGWKEWIKRRLVGLFSSALVGGKRHSDYLTKLGMPAERIFMGYDAVDNRFFSEKAKEIGACGGEARRKHGLPEDYFLASARFVEKKNLPRLLEAYALYRGSCETPWPLALLGDGLLRGALESQLGALGLRDHVMMPGFKQVSDLPAYYALAGAFIHPSTVEPWGLVVNEAMASGLPVLVSNRCGCVPELVSEGVNGFTFDPLNVKELAQKMAQVSAPGFPRTVFGAKSSEIVAEWGCERFARGLSEAIEVALAGPPVVSTRLDRALPRVLKHR
ncbi:MAG TPA: glycosyltransferase [Candidatus Methylacidiphilales bacterium]|jgi:glycosyltransferase involved in cell wall biosynthesis|nr:glycosyltransferase [Candidatus Methylacidiphilales bacterium]